MNGAAAGHFYENYVIGEIIRNYVYGKEKVNLNFYRNSNKKEINLIIEENGVLHPIEIKMSSAPERKAIRAFTLLKDTAKETGRGGIICMADKPMQLDDNNCLIPSSLI